MPEKHTEKSGAPRYRTIYRGGQGEIVEKKSRFIAHVQPASSEEEAIEFIGKIKKQYWDARHNCHAYVIGPHREISRCSDDGEPSGTAGRPMLDVLLGNDLYDTVVVVTRYFGGTLLGTGGLVRAYSAAVREGLNQAVVIEKREGAIYRMQVDYPGLGKVQYLAGEQGLSILESDYGEMVKLDILLPGEEIESFLQKVTEVTGGKAQIEKIRQTCFAMVDGNIELFE